MWIVIGNGLLPQIPLVEIIFILIIFSIFTPIALPVTVIYLVFIPPIGLNVFEAASIIFIYGLSVFWIPLGFLQVSATGKYLSAFDVGNTVKFLQRNYANYIEAWID